MHKVNILSPVVVLYRREVIRLKPLKERVSLTLDGDIIQKLKVLSEDCDRSLSQYINLILKDYLKKLEEK